MRCNVDIMLSGPIWIKYTVKKEFFIVGTVIVTQQNLDALFSFCYLSKYVRRD